MTRDKALKSLKVGAWVATIHGALIAVNVLVNWSERPSGQFALIDAIIFLLCGFGMFKKSRFAAVIMILLAGTKLVISISESNNYFNQLLSIVFIILYFQAIRGAYTLNAIRKSENSTYKGTRRWIVVVGSIFGVVAASAVVLEILAESRIYLRV
ncbi:MAG: hypothetical protein JKY41_12510 [Rhodobacteraceae bacterium]|nr:hypothetical protein [Paracoccaceae bacterium]